MRGFRAGPGFLVAAAFIGPGTIVTASRAGAGYGTALLALLARCMPASSRLLKVAQDRDLGEARPFVEAAQRRDRKDAVA